MDRDDKITVAGPDRELLDLMQRYLQSRGFRNVESVETEADQYWVGQVPDMRMEQQIIRLHGITVDTGCRKAWVDGEEMHIKDRAWELLAFLATNAGVSLSRDIIMERVWGYDSESSDRTIDVHVRWLRKALGDRAWCIVAVKGVGYRMEREE